MAETRAATWWVVIDGKSWKPGQPNTSQRFGPYASEQSAVLAEVDLLPVDSDYVYNVRVEAEAAASSADDS